MDFGITLLTLMMDTERVMITVPVPVQNYCSSKFQVTGNRTTVPRYGKQNYSSQLRETELQFPVMGNRTTVPSYGKQN
jgi:hypothetical protein